jgi:hypothetical protein
MIMFRIKGRPFRDQKQKSTAHPKKIAARPENIGTEQINFFGMDNFPYNR